MKNNIINQYEEFQFINFIFTKFLPKAYISSLDESYLLLNNSRIKLLENFNISIKNRYYEFISKYLNIIKILFDKSIIDICHIEISKYKIAVKTESFGSKIKNLSFIYIDSYHEILEIINRKLNKYK